MHKEPCAIIIEDSREAKCWLTTFAPGNPWLMPADEPLPLPVSSNTGYGTVAFHLHKRFATARIIYRQR